jgi:hypothetical protein
MYMEILATVCSAAGYKKDNAYFTENIGLS